MSPSQFTFSSAFILGMTGFALHRYHLLSALLCLEGMMLSLFTAMSLWLLQMTMTTLTASPLFILAFSACEASVGLAILVATARTHGTDRLKNLDLLQC